MGFKIVRSKDYPCSYVINDDCVMYKPNHKPYFSYKELLDIKNAADNTIKLYIDKGLSENDISEMNLEECSESINTDN
jgi:hypothetical protein